MLITASLIQENIEIADSAPGVPGVIDRLGGRLATQLNISRAKIVQAITARETVRSTALPNGAAIPHCRLKELSRFGMTMLILRSPLKWDQGGGMVDIVLMMAGPAGSVSDHLRILANCSQLLDSRAIRAKLREARGPADVRELLTAAEEAVEQRRSSEGILREVARETSAPTDYLERVAKQFQW